MMLTERQIEIVYNELIEHFIDHGNGPIIISNKAPLTPISIKLPEWRVIGVSKHQESAMALESGNIETRQTFYQNPLVVKQLNRKEEQQVYPTHAWRIKYEFQTGLWELNSHIDENQLRYFLLMNQKLRLLDYINDSISISAHQFNSVAPHTSQINLYRYMEAKEILRDGVTEDPLRNYPSVSLYATELGVSLNDAAKELKIKMECDISYLAELGAMRVKYEKIIIGEQDIKMLKVIKSDYYKQNSRYALFNI